MESNINKISNAEFSLFAKPISNTTPNDNVNVVYIFELIRDEEIAKDDTIELRKIKDKIKNSEFKRTHFHFATFSGRFSKRGKEHLEQHSDLICIDIDHLDSELDCIRKKVNADLKHVIMSFVSPNGSGLKVIYPIDTGQAEHESWYTAYRNYLIENIGIDKSKIDDQCKDVARACFLPYDENVFLNPLLIEDSQEKLTHGDILPIDLNISLKSKNEPTQVVERDEIKPIKDTWTPFFHLDHREKDKELNFKILQNIVEKKFGAYGEQSRRQFIQKLASYANRFGMTLEALIEYSLTAYKEHPASSVKHGKEDPIDINHHILKPIKDTYQTYSDQFDSWMDKNGEGKINISQLFYDSPKIPNSVYDSLPQAFKNIFSNEDDKRSRDVFFLSALTVLSGLLPNVRGVYDGIDYEPNLFFFISAPPSKGKSIARKGADIGWPIHYALRENYDSEISNYQNELEAYKEAGGEPPVKPRKRQIFVGGDASTTGLVKKINDSGGRGIIFETEADSLTKSLNNDWGSFSDLLRKAFHHEAYALTRTKEEECIELDRPKLSVFLTGTPDQLEKLINDVKNGLFSRFCFYVYDAELKFKDVFNTNKYDSSKIYFEHFANEIHELYNQLLNRANCPIEIKFPVELKSDFIGTFDQWTNELNKVIGPDFVASIIRLGLISFRIMMILTILRNKGNIKNEIKCCEDDYRIAMKLVDILKQHAFIAYSVIYKSEKYSKLDDRRKRYLVSLPLDFSRKEADTIAESINIPLKTAELMLSQFVKLGILIKPSHGLYAKDI